MTEPQTMSPTQEHEGDRLAWREPNRRAHHPRWERGEGVEDPEDKGEPAIMLEINGLQLMVRVSVVDLKS